MPWSDPEEHGEQLQAMERELAWRREAGERLEPLIAPCGSRKLVQSFWAQAWSRQLESFTPYEGRFSRGRSLLRKGSVLGFVISDGLAKATVKGKRLYTTTVRVKPLTSERREHLQQLCSTDHTSLLDLLAGRLSDETMRALCHEQEGIFPKADEIAASCTCEDYADLCEHAAAILYGIALMLGQLPELLFTLRSVAAQELVNIREHALDELGTVGGDFQDDDLSGIFGIDLQKGN